MSILKTIENTRRRTIMDMPVEILSDIFTQCLGVGHESSQDPDWYDPEVNPTGFNHDEAPLLLTRVCRLWRAVSQSTQRLWTVLPCLGIDRPLPESGTDMLFRMYLAHSGSAPLSIHIDFALRSGDYVVALLSPHLHRAGKLEIHSLGTINDPPGESLVRLIADHRGRFKLLTHLRLVGSAASAQRSHFSTFDDAPLLENVCLRSQVLNLPWSQIKYYRGHIRDDLRLCTQLETLDLSAEHGDKGKWSVTPTSICLPRLRKLRLTDTGEVIDQFLNSLCAPLLEAIQIGDICSSSPSPVGALIAFIARSHAELTSLRLLCFCVSANELLQLSRVAPALRELDAFLAPDALRALMVSPTMDNIFLHLAQLTIRDVDICDQELIDICQSRFSDPNGKEGEFQVEPLQYCKVYPAGPADEGYGTQQAAQRLQDVAESFRDDVGVQDTSRRLWQVSNSTSGRMSKMSSKDLNDLEECFDFLETYEISHPLLLERHYFTVIMNNFGNIAAPSHIRARASALLAKWRPLVSEYDARETRWRLQEENYGWCTLVYEPDIVGRFVSEFTAVTW